MNLTVVTAPGPQLALIFTLALCVVSECGGDHMSGWGTSGRHGSGTASLMWGDTLDLQTQHRGSLDRTAHSVLWLL